MKRAIYALAALPVLLLAVLAVGRDVSPTQAAPGDPLAAINVPFGPDCFGVGVAFDGTNILYTCQGENAVFKTDLAGTNQGSVATVDAGGNALDLDAIAWDPGEGVLWGGETNTQGTSDCGIWSVDTSTGLATLRFTFPSDAHELTPGCSLSFFDGITVDTVTDTLYVSPDVHTFIHHVNKDGTPAANDNIPFETLTAGLCPWAAGFGYTGCLNSGLAIGLDGNLFAGTASDGKIMQLDPVAPAFIGQFATVSGRDEDLECGPLFTKPDGSVVETILSRDLSDRIDVLEAPDGTCISPVSGPIPSGPAGIDPDAVEEVLFPGQSFEVLKTVWTGHAIVGEPALVTIESDCESESGGFVTATFEPESQLVEPGGHAEFVETIAVDPAAPGGTYECTDRVLVDGEPLIGYDIEQGGVVTPVGVLMGSESVEDFYDYNTIPASSNTGLEESGTSIVFLYMDPVGTISLVMIHDKPHDGSGGAATFAISGIPGGTNWTVKDDNEDPYAIVGGASTVSWAWANCCTDGGALSGGLNGEFWIMIDAAFNEDAEKDPLNPGTIDAWKFLTTEAIDLDAAQTLTIHAEEVVETKVIKVPEGFLTGGGQIGRGSAGQNTGGNVGYLADFSIVGQWQFNDRDGLKMHSLGFDTLQFRIVGGEGPEPPDANANAAAFSGPARVKLGSDSWDESCYFRAEVWDRGEPGRRGKNAGDPDVFGIAIWCESDPDTEGPDYVYGRDYLDAGNFQIHSGVKD